MNINSNIAPFVLITWHQKEPLGCVVYLHFPNNDSYSKCIHSCCLPCSYVTKPVGILQRVIKGYLRYEMITSQNVLSEAQVKRFFILYKSYIWFSRYSSFCIFSHPMIQQIYDVMMSISTWDRVQGVFLNISLEPKLIKSPNLADWEI